MISSQGQVNAGAQTEMQYQALKTLQAIHHLLQLAAIEPILGVQISEREYSHLFTVPKRSGDVSAILDLKWLNRWIKHQKFKTETLRSILLAIKKEDFLVFLDLQDAYLHEPFRLAHRRFLHLLPEPALPIKISSFWEVGCPQGLHKDPNCSYLPS